ncbi:hypothetical protein F2P56_035194 [Juglans regia]|uniref:Wall-associated receptor kinase 2-like n=2 Tax=Juglans regia TaxID=51240 RepID=A0A833TM48_JUGRE|nr:wall-associated receptor kinase 2-like [Juglans regia]KAF5442549.1 hypothetical protein F2P56_035194 [Juglans regia]
MVFNVRMLMKLTWVCVTLSGIIATAAAAPEIAKPNCQDRCGDVEIPYPFGTTEDCYLNDYFSIVCNESFSPPQTMIGNNMVVTNISVHGQLDILMYLAHQCFPNSSGILPYENIPFLRVPAFTISHTQNKFVAVGCDTYAFLNAFQNNEPFSIGCTSTCRSMRNVFNGSCSGIGCCQVEIPKGLKNFSLEARSYDNHTTVQSFNPCSYAFVAKQGQFNFSSSYLQSLQNVLTNPMVLDWAIGNETCEYAQRKSDYICEGNSTCYDPDNNGYGYRCKCEEGYDGNPYLPHGCQDIDECKIGKPCNGSAKCTNLVGSFACTCPRGYEGDGKMHGCIPKARQSWTIIIAMGIGIILLLLLVGGSWVYLGLKRRQLIKLKENFFQKNGGLVLQQKLSSYTSTCMETTRIFSAEELEKATDNYDESRVLGQGGYGTVYKGVLSNNKVVAIKKSKICDQSQIKQFINEVIVLTQINHRNVVKLLGCCLETEVPLLVYEFITNGTLFDYIHNKSLSSSFSWEMRLKIASEIAGALAYLHSATSMPIIHRDVKTANILLDENYSAKVSDFGASRLVPLDQTHIATLVQGTFGYLDPEYFHTSQLTEKSDVYGFGVVVAELLTGKKALSFDRPESDRNLAMYFSSMIKEDRIIEIIDDHIVSEGSIEEVKEVANLAKRCLRLKGEERPTMKEIAMELEGLRITENHWWGKPEYIDTEDQTEQLVSADTFSLDVGNGYSSSTNTTSKHESMEDQVLQAPDDGR